MKNVALFALLLLATLSCAAQSPDEYPITVHVSSARTIIVPNFSGQLQLQQLKVTINSKKYELTAQSDGSLLTLGDYQAKLVQNDHKTAYESLQAYEFRFPDKKTVKFTVTAQSE
ncbi:MAG: hypothetical protein WB680_19490 [Candidatus Acidiferrales bacterium]